MQQQVSIQPATKADFAAIAHLQAESYACAYRSSLPPYYIKDRLHADVLDSWMRCKLAKRDIVLVAKQPETNILVGFISLWCRPQPFIDNLHCHPSCTGQGIGTQLLRAAFQKLLAQGEDSVSLSVLVSNDRARKLYLRLGAQIHKRQREKLFGHPVEVEILTWHALNCQKMAI